MCGRDKPVPIQRDTHLFDSDFSRTSVYQNSKNLAGPPPSFEGRGCARPIRPGVLNAVYLTIISRINVAFVAEIKTQAL